MKIVYGDESVIAILQLFFYNPEQIILLFRGTFYGLQYIYLKTKAVTVSVKGNLIPYLRINGFTVSHWLIGPYSGIATF